MLHFPSLIIPLGAATRSRLLRAHCNHRTLNIAYLYLSSGQNMPAFPHSPRAQRHPHRAAYA